MPVTPQKTVGIIANPASGKDIRRLIASGMTVTNQEKQNTIIRMLLAMDALGVERVEIMPDTTGMGQRVIDEIAGDLTTTRVSVLEMPYILGTQKDSIRAAALMAERDFACIIVMGGDGTSRVVSKSCGEVPLVPVSTGTNNVFPQMIEGTLVGLAAAAVAKGVLTQAEACDRAPRLELLRDHVLIDIALVDLVVVRARDIAARAVWEPSTIHSVFLTQADPAAIGLSAIGGQLQPMPRYSGQALNIRLAENAAETKQTVMAPIAPGLVKTLPIAGHQRFSEGEQIPLNFSPCVIALDGEREVAIREGESYAVRLNLCGPWVVNVERTLALATQKQYLCFNASQDGNRQEWNAACGF